MIACKVTSDSTIECPGANVSLDPTHTIRGVVVLPITLPIVSANNGDEATVSVLPPLEHCAPVEKVRVDPKAAKRCESDP